MCHFLSFSISLNFFCVLSPSSYLTLPLVFLPIFPLWDSFPIHLFLIISCILLFQSSSLHSPFLYRPHILYRPSSLVSFLLLLLSFFPSFPLEPPLSTSFLLLLQVLTSSLRFTAAFTPAAYRSRCDRLTRRTSPPRCPLSR